MPLLRRRRQHADLALGRRSALITVPGTDMAPKRRASEPDVFQLEEDKPAAEKLNLLDGVALKRALDDAVIQVGLRSARGAAPSRQTPVDRRSRPPCPPAADRGRCGAHH